MILADIIKEKKCIQNILSVACSIKLDSIIKINKKSLNSFLIGLTDNEYVALVNRTFLKKDSLFWQSNKEVEIIFDFVENGKTFQYHFKSKIQKLGYYKHFPAIFINYPTELRLEDKTRPYPLIPKDDQILLFRYYIDEKDYREEIVNLSISYLKFYPSQGEKRAKKIFWIGKKIEECSVILPGDVINLSAQITNVQAGGYILGYKSITPDDKKKLADYITKMFYQYSVEDKLGLRSSRHIHREVKDQPAESKARLMILDNNADYCLAFKEFFTAYGYEVIVVDKRSKPLDVIIKQKPGVIFINSNFTSTGSLSLVWEVKKHNFLNQIPVIILTDELTPSLIEKYEKVGGIDVIDQSQDLENLVKKIEHALLLKNGIENKESDKNILFVNRGDDLTAYNLLEWADVHGYTFLINDSLGNMDQKVKEIQPDLILYNALNTRLSLLLEINKNLKKDPHFEDIPIVIKTTELGSDTVKQVNGKTFLVNSFSPDVLNLFEKLLLISPKK